MIENECHWIVKRLQDLKGASILDIGGGTHYYRLQVQSWVGYQLYRPLILQKNRIDVLEEKLVFRKKDILFSIPVELISRLVTPFTFLRRAFSPFLPLARTIFGDCQHIDTVQEGSYDVVFLLSVLEHVVDPLRAVSQAAKVLKKGGLACISIPEICPYHPAPIDTELRLNPDELAKFVSPFFQVIKKDSCSDEVGTRVSILYGQKI